MMTINGHDLVLEAEHRAMLAEQTERDAEAENWAGVCCSRGCRGPVPCEHVAHLADAIRRGKVRRC